MSTQTTNVAAPVATPAQATQVNGPSGTSNVDAQGRSRVWAELWLTPAELRTLEILAESAGIGRRQFATQVAQREVPAFTALAEALKLY